MKESLMQIGELAKRSRVSQRTIHYYERLGLMQPTQREGSGYRYYDDTALQRLEKIRQLQKIGLSLDEIAEVIDLYFEDSTGIKGKRKVLEILGEHLVDTESKISEMQRFRDEMRANIDRIKQLIRDAER